MLTSPYLKEANFRCDCCDGRVTRKGGYSPFYLCEKHASLPIEEIAQLRAAKHGSSECWIAGTIEHERVMVEEYGPAEYDPRGRFVAGIAKRAQRLASGA